MLKRPIAPLRGANDFSWIREERGLRRRAQQERLARVKDTALLLATLVFVLFGLQARFARADARSQAWQLYNRLAGVPPNPELLDRMKKLIESDRAPEAAKVATDSPGFFNVTLPLWVKPISNRARSADVELNDLVATVVGVVRDSEDARTLLTGDFIYAAIPAPAGVSAEPVDIYGSNKHYSDLERLGVDLRGALSRQPQMHVRIAQPPLPYSFTTAPLPREQTAGLLTTRAFARAHLGQGTNRRHTQYALTEFACLDLGELRSRSIPDVRVRRDVARAPGGSAHLYRESCVSCHASLDAASGYSAYLNFEEVRGILQYLPELGVNALYSKLNRNSQNNPKGVGYYTFDDSFQLRFPSSALEWRTAPQGSLSGKGPRAFGEFLAGSRAFSECLVKRTLAKLCGLRGDQAASLVDPLVEYFEDSKGGAYRLDRLFRRIALSRQCLGE